MSIRGMAAGVTDALSEALGAEAVARLVEEGRYRRDAYQRRKGVQNEVARRRKEGA
jgi:hypothetical protein